MRLLLTGASGFVGQAVQDRLLSDDKYILRSVFRKPVSLSISRLEVCLAPNLSVDSHWCKALNQVDAVKVGS